MYEFTTYVAARMPDILVENSNGTRAGVTSLSKITQTSAVLWVTTRELPLVCFKATRYTAFASMIRVRDIIKVNFWDVDMFYSKNGFILRILVASLMIPFWKRTAPLSFICVMRNGPMNYILCLEFFLHLNRILSPTLDWWLLRRIFLRLLLRLIRSCLCCRMCYQSATCLMFKMASRPNTSCVGDACSVVW